MLHLYILILLLFLGILGFSFYVCRTCAASRRSSTLRQCIYLTNMGDNEFLSFINEKWNESPPSILVTRNPKWSQRSSTGTGCVKGRYQHPKYALPKVSCIVLLSNICYDFIVFLIFGLSMVLEKSSLVRRFLSYRVKPNHSNVN